MKKRELKRRAKKIARKLKPLLEERRRYHLQQEYIQKLKEAKLI